MQEQTLNQSSMLPLVLTLWLKYTSNIPKIIHFNILGLKEAFVQHLSSPVFLFSPACFWTFSSVFCTYCCIPAFRSSWPKMGWWRKGRFYSQSVVPHERWLKQKNMCDASCFQTHRGAQSILHFTGIGKVAGQALHKIPSLQRSQWTNNRTEWCAQWCQFLFYNKYKIHYLSMTAIFHWFIFNQLLLEVN